MIDPFALPPETARDFAVRGSAILGIRDSGKTYTAALIAERLFDAVYRAWPSAIRRDAVAHALGLSPVASMTGVYIGAVAAWGLIEKAGKGEVRAADWLFSTPEGA